MNFETNTIIFDVANTHFESDGTTPFLGHIEVRLPNAMLSRLYNIDDPSTLRPGSFAVTTGGAPATTTLAIETGGAFFHHRRDHVLEAQAQDPRQDPAAQAEEPERDAPDGDKGRDPLRRLEAPRLEGSRLPGRVPAEVGPERPRGDDEPRQAADPGHRADAGQAVCLHGAGQEPGRARRPGHRRHAASALVLR